MWFDPRLGKAQADPEGLSEALSLSLLSLLPRPLGTTATQGHGALETKPFFLMLSFRPLSFTALMDLNCPCYQTQPGHGRPSEKKGGTGDTLEGESQRPQDAPDHPAAFTACPAPAPLACSAEGTWPPLGLSHLLSLVCVLLGQDQFRGHPWLLSLPGGFQKAGRPGKISLACPFGVSPTCLCQGHLFSTALCVCLTGPRPSASLSPGNQSPSCLPFSAPQLLHLQKEHGQ